MPPSLSSWGLWQVAQALFGSIPPLSSPSCPTCLQGLQRANRCRRAFEISMPYKFKVFGNGFLINLPTLSFWKRQKSQIHSHFNLSWYFLSRWLKSCLPFVLCISIQRLTPSLSTPGTLTSLEEGSGFLWSHQRSCLEEGMCPSPPLSFWWSV